MSTAPAGPQPPTVHRRPETTDQPSSGVRDTAVTSLADLTRNATEVTFSASGDLGPCEDCVGIHAIAVATVTWPDPDERDGTGEITVCRDCLGAQVAWLAAGLDLDAAITVEVPAWTIEELEGALDLPAWMGRGVNGVPTVFLHAEDGGRYLADEVDHARRLVALSRAGMTLALADTLLRQDPDLARSIAAAVDRLRGAA